MDKFIRKKLVINNFSGGVAPAEGLIAMPLPHLKTSSQHMNYEQKPSSFVFFFGFMLALGSHISCTDLNGKQPARSGSHQRMIDILAGVDSKMASPNNMYAATSRIHFFDSMARSAPDPAMRLNFKFNLAAAMLEYGDEHKSVALYEELLQLSYENPDALQQVRSGLGVAYLRQGERDNCVSGHNSESCIMPIRGNGIHRDKIGARKSIEVYKELLAQNPNDFDSRWLLNIACMTLGEYPDKVPAQWLIPGLDKSGSNRVDPFADVAAALKLDINNRAGGCIIDDFDNDGYLDIVTSAWGLDDPMHFMRNNGDGTFSDRSKESGLHSITGGLNMTSTDYNNDGWLDVFVLRGGWQGQKGFGKQPNSLLRNNGDGTFTDVTTDAGILSYCPTQTATWNDFNNDGWLDVFIGNETSDQYEIFPCELYLNNRNGTFSNIATPELLNIIAFVKGVTSGDYNNDGWPDIFISTQNGHLLLLENMRAQGQTVSFNIVSEKAGFSQGVRTFPTGFFDYDNDGWLDLFVCNYDFERPLSHYAAKEALQPSDDVTGKLCLYKNNRNGTFTNVTASAGVNQIVFAMGANFGDIDNDGFLDLFFGTGNPNYRSLVPNKLFKNLGGKKFADVTVSARVGNLQKGHGVAFADIDNDGDQDIFVEMGGAFRGDAFPSALYMNPGQGKNNWIALKLEGSQSNRLAVGAKVTVKFRENGKQRMVYREVNSGASFGCSPMRREIGVGTADRIDEIVITWPVSGTIQIIKDVKPNQTIKVKEGRQGYEQVPLRPLAFKMADGSIPMCAPAK